MMKRFALLLVTLATMVLGSTTAATAATLTVDFDNAPQGTHFVTGTATPECTITGLVVSCNSYELAGVGNTNAEATLVATYTATVDCMNHGGNIVEVKAQVTGAESSTGQLEPKNGRLLVPALSSSPAPTADEFAAQAICPNPNWTAITQTDTIALSSYTYEVTFAGFTDPAITITGP